MAWTPILKIDILTKFKRDCDALRVHGGATHRLSLSIIFEWSYLCCRQARMMLFLNDAKRHVEAITTYYKVVHHILRRYAIDVVIVGADE